MFEGFIERIGSTEAHEFPPDSVWLNTVKPLSLEMLKGHVVLLDFWTYCCINCMHTIPDLKWIEEKYAGKPVVVIGVHSAKFYNENDPDNIREAIQRYGIEHPVVVDKDMKIWRSYGVRGWPTIVIMDSSGKVVYHQSGEGQRDNIDSVIEVLLERYEKTGKLAVPIEIERPRIERDGIVLSRKALLLSRLEDDHIKRFKP
ncbi:MAG: redoxin family protein [archaeon]|nr:redoxin family protein [archaeon]